MFVSRQRYEALTINHGRLSQLMEEAAHLRKEVRRLTDVIIRMRQEGFSLEPQHTDQQWPGGKYVMDELEEVPVKPTTEQTEEAAEVEAILRRDLERVLTED